MRSYRCPGCERRLFDGEGLQGRITIKCRGCKRVTDIVDGDIVRPPPIEPPSNEEQLLIMEKRWQLQRKRRAEMATGLRFAVFQRDDFTCRYCGKSVQEGAILEADHVLPRSRGGEDSLDNLVTSCWECNSGKASKVLTTSNP